MTGAIPGAWTIALEGTPDFDEAMQRIHAWFEQEVIDRPPIRFSMHNAEYNRGAEAAPGRWGSLGERRLDELEPCIDAKDPEGLYLCIPADPGVQPDVFERVARW